jgi:hypothetical protein
MYEGNCVSKLVFRALEVKSGHQLSYLGLVAACTRDDRQSEILDPWSAILLGHFHQSFSDVQGVGRHWKVFRVSVEEHLPAFSELSIETLSSYSQPMTALAF